MRRISPIAVADIIIAQVRNVVTNTVRVKTYKLDGSALDSAFYIFVY